MKDLVLEFNNRYQRIVEIFEGTCDYEKIEPLYWDARDLYLSYKGNNLYNKWVDINRIVLTYDAFREEFPGEAYYEGVRG